MFGQKKVKRKVTKENVGFFEQINELIKNSGRPLIIFPQGTRLLPDDRTPFKKGASRIYNELGIKCQPVAINSGYSWPKTGKKNPNLNLTISILSPIKEGIDKEDFLILLQKKIYSELDRLN